MRCLQGRRLSTGALVAQYRSYAMILPSQFKPSHDVFSHPDFMSVSLRW